jgi:hypothetical protein
MADRAFLSRFTPSRTDPAILERIFVQREALARDTVERVRESVLTGNKHHLLFIGPRGSGKTHFVSLIHHRIAADDSLRDRMRIAWLAEDETTTSFAKFLQRIYRALADRYPDEFPRVAIELLQHQSDESGRAALLSRLLTEKLQGRTLLLIVENLAELFEGMRERGQQDWRAFLQENPTTTTLATSQRLFRGISARTSPFFGFFQPEHLKPLGLDDAVLLLRKIAEVNEDAELASFLQTPTGRNRVHVLHHLAGGNPRVYIILSDFITRASLDELVGPFEKLIDELTPYYQARLKRLSPQQREIVEFLCKSRHAVPVKEIADRLFISHQTLTSQLKDMRENRYVEGRTVGREARYELQEPLMRLSVEVKENPGQPIRRIVEFLRAWHTPRRLEQQLRETDPRLDIMCSYILERHRDSFDPYERALDINPQLVQGAHDRAGALLNLNQWDQGLKALEDCLHRFGPSEHDDAGDVESILHLAFAHSEDEAAWRNRLELLVSTYAKAEALVYLGTGLVRSLKSISEVAGNKDRLADWRDVWHDLGKGQEPLEIPLRIFDVGVRYLQTGDRRVLLDLVREERRVLAEALGLDSEDGSKGQR